MKKVFFSLLAIAALASCAKTEPTYTSVDSEIKLAPVTAMSTKAGYLGVIDGTTYPTDESFNVYAYWMNEVAGSTFTTGATTYLNNVKFVNKGQYWGGTTPYYWPKNGSLRFAAYSPADLTMTHDLATDKYYLNNLTYPATVDATYDILMAPTSVSYDAATAAERVSVVFEHALSWLTFKLQSTAVAANQFLVTDVIINDVNTQGNVVADLKAGEFPWNTATPATFNVFNDANGTAVTTTATTVENGKGNSVLVLPQATTTVTIKFTQVATANTPALEGQEITIPLILDQNKPWEAGKHYIYNVIFDLDEILINPSVEDWEDVEVPSVEATAAEVANSEELLAALAAGRSVRLVDDIVLSAPATVTSGDVLVELNGHNVTSAEDAFVVNGGVLSINGPGVVTAASDNGEPFCAVWAYGNGVANIYGGEFKCGYPVGDYNDLIYAKDNAVINVYGGKFYNSGRDNAFVLNLKDNSAAKINVYGGSFEKFDPSLNLSENPQMDFLAAGYNVLKAGDWYTVYPSTGANIVLASETVVDGTLNLTDGSLDGNNQTLTVPSAVVASNYITTLKGNVKVSNLTIDGKNAKTESSASIRGFYVSGANEGTYVLENVIVDNCGYAMNLQATKPNTLMVTNSTLEGWTSYNSNTTATFTDVEFTVGDFFGADNKNYSNNDNGLFRPYGTTVLYNCSFADGFVIDLGSLAAGKTIVFDNCTYNGKPLAEENLEGAEGKAWTIR